MTNQDINKINKIKLPNEQEYVIDATYWGGKTLSDIKPSDFGLSSVLKYCGITTTPLEDGSEITTVIIDKKEHKAEIGCVVFYEDKEGTQEFVYNGSKWELLGKDLTYKVVQNPISSPNVSGDATAFIDTISQDANGVITATKKNVDMPIVKGDAENSAVLKGGNNQVISEGGVALGADNLVGLKGFYYKYITLKAGGNTKLANVYLSKTQVSNPTIDTNSGASFKDTSIKPQNYWAVGDIISIVNDAKYDDIATIKQVKDGLVQIEWLDGKSPFSTLKPESDLSSEDYSIYCLDKPTQGISDLGKYSFATGTDNKAINAYTEVSGKGNVVKGKFGKVWGKDNIGGYNTTTFGSGNVNLADNSLVSGTNNINEGNNSVIHGNKNKNYGKRAFVVGNENITNNENEAAFGKYNNSKNDTQFSIGIGTSKNDRKNGFEVKQNGDIYIEGVEGKIQDKLNEISQINKTIEDNEEVIATALCELNEKVGEIEKTQEKVFIMPEDFFEEEYNEPDENGYIGKVKREYVIDILENGYTKILSIEDGIPYVYELDYFDLHNDVLKIKLRIEHVQENNTGETINIIEINTNRDSVDFCKYKRQLFIYNFPFTYSGTSTPENSDGYKYLNFINSVITDDIDLPEENKQLFKKNMGSFANWNAQEGEAGYIENKPFYGGNVIRTVGSSVITSPTSFTINNYYRAKILTFRYRNSDGEYTNIDFDLDTSFGSTIVGDGFEMYVSYNINYPNATIEFRELTLNGGWVQFLVNEYDMLKTLDDKYLPDTVIKTTPQTLTDTDKNQVKENLGISTPATPDWNAQKGEAGYIENRTHYVTGTAETINLNGEYGITKNNITVNVDSTIDISWNIDFMGNHTEGSCRFTGIDESNYYSFDNGGFNIDFINNGGLVDLNMYAFGGGEPHYGTVTIGVDMRHKTLDEVYIPDTIARKSDIPVPIIINYNTIKDAANSEVNTISEQTWLKYIANDTYKNYDWIIQRDGIKYNCTVIPDYDNKHIQILYFTRNEIEGTSGPLGNAIMKYSGLRIQLLPYTENTYLIYKISNGGSLETREFVFGENYNKNAYLIAAAQMSGIDTIDCKWVYTTKDDSTITVNGQYFHIENSITNVDAIFSVKDKSLTYVDGNGLINKVTFADNGSYDISKNNPDISDTVVKTTPQTLSDADKNQALSNLGLSDVATTLTTLDERIGKIESNIASESEIDDAILGILEDINLVSENDINKLLNSSF